MAKGERIKKMRTQKGITQEELAKFLNTTKQNIYKYENNIITNIPSDKIEQMAEALDTNSSYIMGWTDYNGKNNNAKLRDVAKKSRSDISSVRINVYGRVRAGFPQEAVEDIVDWEDLPKEWTIGNKEFIGLRVEGDSMAPKYIEGDTIIIQLQPDCESGQDCVVYVNGCDATLKKIVKQQDGILLQPLNPNYLPQKYDYNDEECPVTILGIIVEIRRKV